MTFIGPRPPLRCHVEACPELYKIVLSDLPGITGLATVLVHRREERLLSRCRSASETEEVYRAHCIALKARLDGIYRRNQCLSLDLFILWRTLLAILPFPRAKAASIGASDGVQKFRPRDALEPA